MNLERQIFETKLREADERVAAWEVENAELVQKCELLRTEKLKIGGRACPVPLYEASSRTAHILRENQGPLYCRL
jgi:hypothetical protein